MPTQTPVSAPGMRKVSTEGPPGPCLGRSPEAAVRPLLGLTAWIWKINTQDAHSRPWPRLWKSCTETVNVCIHEVLDPERATSPVSIFSWLSENSPPYMMGFPGGSDGKESACNAGDPGSSPGLGRSPGEGHGNPLQDSSLENPVDRGACWATVHGVTKSRT